MGLSESSITVIIKPFPFLPHCKVSCYSPCCASTFGEGNDCICNIGTHETIDSDGEDTGNITPPYLELIVIIIL